MAVIIGSNTVTKFDDIVGDGSGAYCIISVNWSANPNVQRLFCLGSWTPTNTIKKPTNNLSLTMYAPGPVRSVSPSTTCDEYGADALTIQASVSPAACGGDVTGIDSSNWYITSYSYSKDDSVMPGQESWSMMDWIAPTGGEWELPDYVLRGISEGQTTTESTTGVVIDTEDAESTTGSVSAGGIGRADTLSLGTVSSVGGGSSDVGDTGQGSANIPYTPLYLGEST
jgi:hypothetical protein